MENGKPLCHGTHALYLGLFSGGGVTDPSYEGLGDTRKDPLGSLIFRDKPYAGMILSCALLNRGTHLRGIRYLVRTTVGTAGSVYARYRQNKTINGHCCVKRGLLYRCGSVPTTTALACERQGHAKLLTSNTAIASGWEALCHA